MTVIDNATDALKNVPRGVWLTSLGVGGAIGLVILIRNRDKRPEDEAPDSTASDSFNTAQESVDASPSGYPAQTYGDYGSGGYGAGGYGPDSPAVSTGQGYVPWEEINDVFNTGLQTGVGLLAAGYELGQSANDIYAGGAASTPATPTVAAPVAAAPTSAAISGNCPANYPFHNANHKSGKVPDACYRVVLKDGDGKPCKKGTKERWHYYHDGYKVYTKCQ